MTMGSVAVSSSLGDEDSDGCGDTVCLPEGGKLIVGAWDG
jgi:hypothetical protein